MERLRAFRRQVIHFLEGDGNLIVIGTSGYAYDDWAGRFYPEDLNKRDRLAYYARHFPFTEVNCTFYQMPNRFMLWHMQEKTPDGFQFAIKAYKGISHTRDNLAEDCRQLKEALSPLQEVRKLACILVQFPNSYHNTAENREYLAAVSHHLDGFPVAVEFRHRSWVAPAVFTFMRELNLGYVCVDQPRFKSLMPPVAVSTASLAYVRFHGRNYDKWWRHDQAHERYDYLYTEEELSEWVPRLRQLEEAAGTVYVAMNNHYQGKAAVNARMLQQLLQAN